MPGTPSPAGRLEVENIDLRCLKKQVQAPSDERTVFDVGTFFAFMCQQTA